MNQIIQSYNDFFWKQVNKYDLNNSNVLRKLIHSYQVANVCYTIACAEKWSEDDRNFCYLIGLLHDLGRFEQWEKYQTYDDAKSIDHGELSSNMLKKFDCQKDFFIDKNKAFVMSESIRFHTKSYEGNDAQIIKYNCVLKDADAYANVVSTASGMQQMTVSGDGYTQQILDSFYNQTLMPKISPKTKLDRCLMLTACCYYVKNLYLREQIRRLNYIDIIFHYVITLL